QRGASQPQHGGDVDFELLGEALRGDFGERAVESEPRVAHQQVERVLLQPLLDFAALVRIPEVRGQDVGRYAMCSAQLRGNGLQTLTGTGDQNDIVAAGGELLGELGAESGAGTGDQGGRHGVSLTGKITAGRASRSTGRDHASGP